MKDKKGQVWIETVIYTLIGLALIGMILAFALPKITKTQEKILVEQTIESLKVLDQTIINVAESGEDNVRSFEISFKEGDLQIDAQNDSIYFILTGMDSYYSQKDVVVTDGRVGILSSGNEDSSNVKIYLNYTGYADISYDGTEDAGKITRSPVAYKLLISNLGNSEEGLPKVDIKLA